MKRPKLLAIISDKKGNVLSTGVNSYVKTHPLQAKYAQLCMEPSKVFLHAEISALVRLKGGEPYRIAVFRYGRLGEARNAKPCRICERAIKDFGIKVVEYTI